MTLVQILKSVLVVQLEKVMMKYQYIRSLGVWWKENGVFSEFS